MFLDLSGLAPPEYPSDDSESPVIEGKDIGQLPASPESVQDVCLVVGATVPLEVSLQGVLVRYKAQLGMLLICFEGCGPGGLWTGEVFVGRHSRVLVQEQFYVLGTLFLGGRGEI